MNIREIREKYPQYGNISDKELAERLHQKYYKDMDFADFSRRIGYKAAVQPEINLPPLSPELRAQPSGNYGNGVLAAGLGGLGEGLLGGAESFLNGATLGGYGWLNRKLGGNADKRRQELQAMAESEGLGGLNRAADFAAGLSGGLRGASRATAALGNRLLGSRLWNLPAYAASGAADAGIMSAFDNDFSDAGAVAQDALDGAVLGGAFGLGGNLVVNPLSKVFSAKELTKGLKGGLNNVVDNSDAVRIVRRGIGASDDVAQEFMNKAPAAARGINAETADMINSSLNRRIDVLRTIASQKQKYRDFMEANAGREVVDFSPKPQLEAIRTESGFNPNKNLTKKQAEELLRNRAEQSGVGIYNDDLSNLPEVNAQGFGINHFFSGGRRPYVRTLHNTLGKPDLKYTQNGRNYAIKKYTDNSTGKDFYDFVILDNGELFNKFPTNSNYVANQFKNGVQDVSLNAQIPGAVEPIHGAAGNQFTAPMQDVSLHRRLPSDLGGEIRSPRLSDATADGININPNGLVVNPELPHYLTLYEGLTPYQVKALSGAVKRGGEKTNNKLGTLDSMNKIKQELNDYIMKSKVPDDKNSLNLVDTSNTKQLREVKQRVDRTLGDALKGRDRSYHKAKGMEEAYNAGRRYNPNAAGNDALIPSLPPLERNAFTQGLYRRMTHNPLTGNNLANNALKYENVLSDVLSPSRYNSLMDGLNRQSVRYNRLAQLGGRAQNKLVMPEKDWLFAREQLESKGSMLGAGLDWVNEALRGRAYEQAAKNLLNPNFVGTEGSWLTENYPTLSAYLSGMFAAQ